MTQVPNRVALVTGGTRGIGAATARELLRELSYKPYEAPRRAVVLRDADRMRENLAAIRERGYAITRGQRITGSVGIAAPIFAPNWMRTMRASTASPAMSCATSSTQKRSTAPTFPARRSAC